MTDDEMLAVVMAEAEMEDAARAAAARLAALYQEGLAIGGHWGPDSEAFADALEAMTAYTKWAPGWWLPWVAGPGDGGGDGGVA